MDVKEIQKKMKLAEGLFNFAYTVKSHQLRKKHSNWSEQKVKEETMKLIEKGCQ